MNITEILARCDHTLLLQTATWEEIRAICDDGMKYQTASVCIPPCYVKQAKEYVGDRLAICTVIGFPNGDSTTAVKCFETAEALREGADEIDMVIHVGDLKAGNDEKILEEIRAIKKVCGDKILKVIIETCLLTDEEIIKMTEICNETFVNFIKTSTGFSTAGAKVDDIELINKYRNEVLEIKASGGIKDIDTAYDMINAGATRIGTSSGVELMNNECHCHCHDCH